jgi:hypothetical protein
VPEKFKAGDRQELMPLKRWAVLLATKSIDGIILSVAAERKFRL